MDLREGPPWIPNVRAAHCYLSCLQAAAVKNKESMRQSQETRLMHVRSFDTKLVVAWPVDEAPAAYFLCQLFYCI